MRVVQYKYVFTDVYSKITCPTLGIDSQQFQFSKKCMYSYITARCHKSIHIILYNITSVFVYRGSEQNKTINIIYYIAYNYIVLGNICFVVKLFRICIRYFTRTWCSV